jgi:uncharacterized membrane protein YfcA
MTHGLDPEQAADLIVTGILQEMIERTLIDGGLFAVAFLAWAVSTFAAGGGSMLLVAAASGLLRGHAIAPVVTLASLAAGAGRIAFFWRHVDWRVARWYLPGATGGALLGGWMFTRLSAELVQVLIALFLISTAWQFRLGERARSFEMRLPWFVPVSFVSGFTSALVGASGLLANPFYLNFGMVKERMLATRALNSIGIQLAKLAAYCAFGALTLDLALHGIWAGMGAVLAIWVTRPWLHRLPSRRFRQLAVLVMFAGGVLLLASILRRTVRL